ncbi:MAG: hypothetical protein AAF638_04420 [Pseudomonadota bacterium]
MAAVVVLSGLILTACGRGQEYQLTEEDRARIPAALSVQNVRGCPRVAIRSGAQSLTRFAPGRDGIPEAVTVQAAITETARECSPSGRTMTMRVGVAGRIVRGPAGDGTVTVSLPVRVVAVLRETEVAYSELQRVTLEVPAATSFTDFRVVDDQVTFEVPDDASGASYTILVGFDPS